MGNVIKYIVFLIASILILASCERQEDFKEEVYFKACSPIPIGRVSSLQFVIDDEIYVLAGRKGKGKSGYLNDIWRYDTQKDNWEQLKTNEDFAPRVKGVAEVVDGIAYVGLGYNSSGVYNKDAYLKDFWAYNPIDSSWTQKADFPNNRTSNTSCFVIDQYIYVMFGFQHFFSSNIFRYDTVNDSWEQILGARIAARSGAVSAQCNNRYFAGTGYDTDNRNDWLEFLPNENRWEKKAKVPHKGQVFGQAVGLNNKIFLTGGRYFGGTMTRQVFYDRLFEYDVLQNKWQITTSLPGKARESHLMLKVGNSIYYGLGQSEEGEILNDLYRWEEK